MTRRALYYEWLSLRSAQKHHVRWCRWWASARVRTACAESRAKFRAELRDIKARLRAVEKLLGCRPSDRAARRIAFRPED